MSNRHDTVQRIALDTPATNNREQFALTPFHRSPRFKRKTRHVRGSFSGWLKNTDTNLSLPLSVSLFPSTVNSREKKHPSWRRRGFKGVCVVRSGGARSARNPILDEKARGRWLRSVEKFLPLKRWDFIEGELYLPTFFAIPPLAPFSQRPHRHVSMSPLSTLLLLAPSSLFCLIFLIYLIFFFFLPASLLFIFVPKRKAAGGIKYPR